MNKIFREIFNKYSKLLFYRFPEDKHLFIGLYPSDPQTLYYMTSSPSRVAFEVNEPVIYGALGQGRGLGGQTLPRAERIRGHYGRGGVPAWQMPQINARDLAVDAPYSYLMAVY